MLLRPRLCGSSVCCRFRLLTEEVDLRVAFTPPPLSVPASPLRVICVTVDAPEHDEDDRYTAHQHDANVDKPSKIPRVFHSSTPLPRRPPPRRRLSNERGRRGAGIGPVLEAVHRGRPPHPRRSSGLKRGPCVAPRESTTVAIRCRRLTCKRMRQRPRVDSVRAARRRNRRSPVPRRGRQGTGRRPPRGNEHPRTLRPAPAGRRRPARQARGREGRVDPAHEG